MQSDNLNVFDLDGTLIKVNSFKEISKKLVIKLLKRCRVISLLNLTSWYLIKKLNFIEHLKFKQQVVEIFEKNLTEEEKQDIVQAILNDNINSDVFEQMLKADNCVISTSAPFAFVSRMSFKKNAVVISSLDYNSGFADISNFGPGKVENLKSYFRNKDIHVSNFYTNSVDDQALVDFSANAFMVKDGCITKVK